MGMKKKHIKQLKKLRQKRETDKKKVEPEIDFDTSAYVIYNRLDMTYPCLSFDIITDEFGSDLDRVTKYPLSLRMVAGAQTPPHVENNYIYVMKVDNIGPLKQEDEDEKEDESDQEDEQDDPNTLPKLTSVRVAHKGCVNRLRLQKLGGRLLTASWSDTGKVHIYDLTTQNQAVSDQKSINTYTAQKVMPKPIYTFGGHLTEGYALDWSKLKPGGLASGDCKKNIHVWNMRTHSDWIVDQQPLVGHENSVEDIKWSPAEPEILASCSVDKTIRLWDLRQPSLQRCVATVTNSHRSDVNVIDWNHRIKHMIVSGGDDGFVKVWDTRMLLDRDDKPCPSATFDYHKKPITSVEWNPNDDTVLAVSSDDDKLTLWDLAVERDEEQEEIDAKMEDDDEKSDKSKSSEDEEDDNDDDEDMKDDDDEDMKDDEDKEKEDEGVVYADLKTIPEQMLFLHQGQVEIKELHWHPQYNGLVISTALNGINIFKTISA